MKAQINRLKSDRGFTLLELTTALFLFFIIMAAVFAFTSYTAETTNFTHEHASIQNEMRLMMKLIRDEVTTARGVRISNNTPRSDLTTGNALHTMSLLGFDENNSRKTFSIERKPTGGTSTERVWDFNELPYLEVNFEIKQDTHNILVITLTNNDPDPRYQLTLSDTLFLPNARKQLVCGRPTCIPCICTPPNQPPPIISPAGGGNSLLIISPNPAPTKTEFDERR